MSINDPTQFPQGPTVAQQFSQALSNIPQSSGVDISGMQNMGNPFQYQAAGLAKTSGGTTALKNAALANSLQQQQGIGLGAIGHAIGNVYNDLSGGMQGWRDNGFQGMVQGFLHPGQAHQQYAQLQNNLTANMTNPVQKWATHTLNDVTTDPLTYLPVGKIAELTGVTRAAGAAKDAIKAGIAKVPAAADVANAASALFKPVNGARRYFVDAISHAHGSVQSADNANQKWLESVFAGTTPEQQDAITHALESTPTGTPLSDPSLEALRTRAELVLSHATQNALDNNLIKGEINPADYGVARYIPHVGASKLDENAAPFSDITTRKTTVDASKSRGLEGTIQAINDASKAAGGQKVFETSLPKILAYHLGQQTRAIEAKNLIQEAMLHGIPTETATIKAGDIFPGTLQRAVEYSHDGQSVLLPESEARYLQGLNVPRSTMSKVLNGAYRGGVNTFNRSMFLSNPFIHIVNNLGTQTLLHHPSVMGKMLNVFSPETRATWKEAFTGVQPGSKMDDALQAGALHLTSEIGKNMTSKNLANNLVKTLNKQPASNSFQSIGRGIKKGWNFYNNLTPNTEKVYRSMAFQHATAPQKAFFGGKGMTPEEAANYVRGIYGGNAAPDTASPAEKVASFALPFFNWTKTAVGSNLKNALKNPVPYVAGYHALNDYNQQVTGHGMGQNPNPLSVALPWKDKNGNQEYWTLYAPPFDAAKLGKDMAQNGVLGGAEDFAFNRTNPLVKYATQMSTHEQNPFALPQNKFNVDPYPYLPSQYNYRGVLFGDKGWKAPAGVAQLMQDVSNPVSDAIQVGSESPQDAILSKLLGGSISAPNPQSKIKEQNYTNSQIASELKSWAKKNAAK